MSNNKCNVCNTEFRRTDRTVKCFVCEEERHNKCSGISEETAKKLGETDIIAYICPYCRNKKISQRISEETAKKLGETDIIAYICPYCRNKKISQQINNMNEKLNECIKTITEQNNFIHKILETVVVKDNANKVATNFTYSEILKNNKDAILIKPKKDGQKSQETEEDIRKKIDPSELAVGIETIKTVGKGTVVINCSDNNSKEKLRENVEKTIGNKYEIIDPKLSKKQGLKDW
ncbi:hypothetical protein QE152_g26731 [Popillia japonica]|uniref:Zinc finger PHD-type domain-containing protein n=1 Tax=Popillia japonica TaxID=7064 RepID=A0AAW1JXC9_POPJA